MSEDLPPLPVQLSHHGYEIHVGRGLGDRIAEVVERLRARRRPFAVVVDSEVRRLHRRWLDRLLGQAPMIEIPSGEASKGFDQLQRVCAFLADARIDRSGVLFAVGGGVTGDLAGFAAAAYLRGIPFYQIPTTLLAMVDSSVGGKTGINLRAGKNLVGAFHQPEAVFADLELLSTLPPREFSAGMAEVIKYGMLADRALFEKLEALEPRLSPGHAELAAVIRHNCWIKAGVVQADEKEEAASGGRALLNLGHTFGHAIEAVAGYGDYLHGEAIAIGLVLATRLSIELGSLEPEWEPRVGAVLSRYLLPTALRRPLSLEGLVAAMSRDKKVREGSLKFVSLRAMGEAQTVSGVQPTLVEKLWRTVGAV